MRKIRGLVVRKSWAKQARRAMFYLYPPAKFQDADRSIGPPTHGFVSGCCNAFDTYPAADGFKRFMNPPYSAMNGGYWWPRWHYLDPDASQGYTARIIALETFALYCEEHGV